MKKIIIANWKCNPDSFVKARKLFHDIKLGTKRTKNIVVICPSFVHFSIFKFQLGNKIKSGAQNVFWEQGAHTGEVSNNMLKDLKIKYVIIGHSERRALNETDLMINKKARAVLKAGLIPILCVGEKKGENAEKIVISQLEKALNGVNSKKVIIAYEPVWAIGTNDFCSPNKANKVRELIKKKYKNRIIYGGSVNSKIVNDYSDFDGVLVGNASLEAKEFIKLVKNA